MAGAAGSPPKCLTGAQLVRPDRHGAVAFSREREWQEVAAAFGGDPADPAVFGDFIQLAELPLFPARA